MNFEETLFKWFSNVLKYFQWFSLVERFTNRDWPYHQTCLSWDLDLFFQRWQNYHQHHRIVFPWLELPNHKFQHFQPSYCVSPCYIVVPKVDIFKVLHDIENELTTGRNPGMKAAFVEQNRNEMTREKFIKKLKSFFQIDEIAKIFAL